MKLLASTAFVVALGFLIVSAFAHKGNLSSSHKKLERREVLLTVCQNLTGPCTPLDRESLIQENR